MSTPTIPVRGEIKLGQFVKLASLAEDGAQARELIQAGDVTVNGEVETRRGHHLSAGDLVEVDAPLGQGRRDRWLSFLSDFLQRHEPGPYGPGSHHLRARSRHHQHRPRP